MTHRLRIHAEPSESLIALASLKRAIRAAPDVAWGDLGESVDASIRRITRTSRELALAGRRCSPAFGVHRASVGRRYTELQDLVTCRGVIDLPRDETSLLRAISLLEVLGRIEGHVVQVRLDGVLVSVQEATAAVNEVLAGARPQQHRDDASQAQEPREERARSRRRRTAQGVEEAAAAMRFFLDFTGIETPTTQAELTRAFRRGARKLHPDVRPGDAAAQEEFCVFKMGYDEMMRATPKGYRG